MPLPRQSHERSRKPAVQCAGRKWRDTRRLDRSIKRFVVSAESFVARTVSRLVNVENRDHEARPIVISTDATGRLDVFRARLRLPELRRITLNPPRPMNSANQPKEWKLVSLRECPTPEQMQLCDTPERSAEYWRSHVMTHPHFNPACECFVVLLLNTRRRIKGHHLVSIGTLDTILVHPREVMTVRSSSLAVMQQGPSNS